MAEHRDETASHKSLEEEILAKIDEAAATAEEPAKEAVRAANIAKRTTIMLVVFVVAFAISNAVGLIRTQQAINQIEEVAENNRQYVQAGCVEGNKSRREEYNVIFGILKDAYRGPRAQTPEAQAQLNKYKVSLQEAYFQLDCTKVTDGERVVVPFN